jgi:hypothetical protein
MLGDPEVGFVTEPGDAGQIEERCDGPTQRQPPGHPTEGPETVIDRMAGGRNQVHFI